MTLMLVATIVKVDAEIRGVLVRRKGRSAHQNVIRVHHVEIVQYHHQQPKNSELSAITSAQTSKEGEGM